jgi:hypothetical protein
MKESWVTWGTRRALPLQQHKLGLSLRKTFGNHRRVSYFYSTRVVCDRMAPKQKRAATRPQATKRKKRAGVAAASEAPPASNWRQSAVPAAARSAAQAASTGSGAYSAGGQVSNTLSPSTDQNLDLGEVASDSDFRALVGYRAGEVNLGTNPVEHSIGMPTWTMPLGASVAHSVKEKIWRGEFVELGGLLGENGAEVSGGINQGSLGFSAGGTLTWLPPRARQIGSIEQWTDAFLVYMAI